MFMELIYGNIAIILLVVFECIYVFINPKIDKGFELRRVFDFRRMANIKTNVIKNVIGILVTWVTYIVSCKLMFIGMIPSNEQDSWIEFRPRGYAAYLLLVVSIYMLNTGMTEKLIYKVFLIIIFASGPVITLIGIINLYALNEYMGIITLFYGVIFVISLIMFIHYWTKEDVR